MVQDRLTEFGVDCKTEVVAVVNDGASVMVKFGNLAPFEQQLCFSHAIHLAVTDVIYKKEAAGSRMRDEEEEEEKEEEVEVEEKEEEEEEEEEELSPLDLREDIGAVVKKVRCVVRYFRKSPKRNEVLQKYVLEERNQELSVVIDCKTRWNSLQGMIQRYFQLRIPISKALIDLRLPHDITNSDCELLEDLLAALTPLKLGSERLGRRDSNLLTAEGTCKFMFAALEKTETKLCQDLLLALRKRVGERRKVDLVSLAKFLQDPSCLSTVEEDDFFEMPSKNSLVKTACGLLTR